MNDLNLKEITSLIANILKLNLDSSKYQLKIEEYSWCVTIYICDLDGCHLHEINIRRFNHDGMFGIGVPDYDKVNYLVSGDLSNITDELVSDFFTKWNHEVNYRVKRTKEQLCEYEEMKIKLFK